MDNVSFMITRFSSATPQTLWRSLARGVTSGWPLLQECVCVRRGTPVMFDLPAPEGGNVRASGRIADVDDGISITLAQETPWIGRIKMTLHPEAGGTRISLAVTMEDAALDWLIDPQPQGHAVGASNLEVRIGLLVSLSGTAGVMGRSIVNAATLAVEELNASRAFGRRSAALVVGDERTDPDRARRAYLRMVRQLRCDVVITSVSSASLQNVRSAAGAGALVLNTAMAERHRERQQNFIDLGESPLEQLLPSIPRIMTDSGASNWYLVGNDYVWPRTVSRLAARLIAKGGGRVQGARFAALGAGGFDAILEGIEESGSDLVLSCFIGEDAIRFEREFHARGLRGSVRTLATNFDASLLDHVGIEAASGLWASSDHAALLGRDTDLGARYTRRFGIASPPLTGLARAAYDGVHLFARAAAEARSLSPVAVAERIRTGRVGSSVIRGRVQGKYTPASLAEVTAHGFRPVALR